MLRIQQAVILAAGESSRFWPLCEGQHKSLFALCGKPLIVWTLEALARAGVERAVIVQGPHRPIERALRGLELPVSPSYVVQPEPKGMGDALLCAQELLDEKFFVLHGHSFTADRWLPLLARKAEETRAEIVLAGKRTEEPWKYGILELEGDRALGIVEKPPPERAPGDTRVLGFYLLPRAFCGVLEEVGEDHYSFEAALGLWMKERGDVRVVVGEGPSVSLKYPWDLFDAVRLLLDERLEPYRAPTAKVHPTAVIEGKVYLAENVRVYEYAVLKGPLYVGEGCVIGTHAIVREYCDLEPQVTVGAHAEVARCLFQRGASTHSGYFGDSIFDAGARAGAGTVTANVKVHRDEIKPVVRGQRVPTGRRSLGAIVGAETQLGIGVLTMPGVLIGARAFVGPGTVVNENVPSGVRYYAKPERIVKAPPKRRASTAENASADRDTPEG